MTSIVGFGGVPDGDHTNRSFHSDHLHHRSGRLLRSSRTEHRLWEELMDFDLNQFLFLVIIVCCIASFIIRLVIK